MIGISAGILLVPLIIVVAIYVLCRVIKKPNCPEHSFGLISLLSSIAL